MPSRKQLRNPVAVEKEKVRKEKKRALREQRSKVKHSKALVDTANSLSSSSIVSGLSAFTSFTSASEQRNFSLEAHKRVDLSDSMVDWAYKLTKANMEGFYKDSEDGWSGSSKKEELDDERAWYLIAYESGEPVAFSHFRFDLDGEDEVCCEVLYCYELHVRPNAQSLGLGKHMMRMLELIAFQAEMSKVVLTCFKHNPRAMRFYKEGLAYKVDVTSPIPGYDGEDFDYEILSKDNKRKAKEHLEEADPES